MVVHLDTRRIRDWDSFHDVFADAFGFPSFYGRNMNAWIDCTTCLDDPKAAMSKIHVAPGDVVTIHLDHGEDFATRCPEQYRALLESAAFVNARRLERGYTSVLALSFEVAPDLTQAFPEGLRARARLLLKQYLVDRSRSAGAQTISESSRCTAASCEYLHESITRNLTGRGCGRWGP